MRFSSKLRSDIILAVGKEEGEYQSPKRKGWLKFRISRGAGFIHLMLMSGGCWHHMTMFDVFHTLEFLESLEETECLYLLSQLHPILLRSLQML